MPAPPRRTADRHDRPREPGLLPAAGRCPGGRGPPRASGPVWPDAARAEQTGPSSQQDRGRAGLGHKGPRAQRVPRVSTLEKPQRQASTASPCAWGTAPGQGGPPAQLVPDSLRVPPLHAAPPARHHPTRAGLGLLVAKYLPQGDQSAAGAKPDTQREKAGLRQDGRRCWRQSRLLEPKAWAR